jgi:hypothetical protein
MWKVFVLGVPLFALCLAAATGLLWILNHWILGNDLWLVIDLLQGALVGVPLFAIAFVWLWRRVRRPKILEGRRRIFGE